MDEFLQHGLGALFDQGYSTLVWIVVLFCLLLGVAIITLWVYAIKVTLKTGNKGAAWCLVVFAAMGIAFTAFRVITNSS